MNWLTLTCGFIGFIVGCCVGAIFTFMGLEKEHQKELTMKEAAIRALLKTQGLIVFRLGSPADRIGGPQTQNPFEKFGEELK